MATGVARSALSVSHMAPSAWTACCSTGWPVAPCSRWRRSPVRMTLFDRYGHRPGAIDLWMGEEVGGPCCQFAGVGVVGVAGEAGLHVAGGVADADGLDAFGVVEEVGPGFEGAVEVALA